MLKIFKKKIKFKEKPKTKIIKNKLNFKDKMFFMLNTKNTVEIY